jgi:hypothetical protein
VKVEPFRLSHRNVETNFSADTLETAKSQCQLSLISTDKYYIISKRAVGKPKLGTYQVSRQAEMGIWDTPKANAQIRQVCNSETEFKQNDEHGWTKNTPLSDTSCHPKPRVRSIYFAFWVLMDRPHHGKEIPGNTNPFQTLIERAPRWRIEGLLEVNEDRDRPKIGHPDRLLNPSEHVDRVRSGSPLSESILAIIQIVFGSLLYSPLNN